MILGIDIGGTNIKFGIINENYEVLDKREIPTQAEKGIEQLIARMIDTCHELHKEYPYQVIGIGTPGDLDDEKKVCVVAGNLPYNNTPLVNIFEEALSVPVYMENDGNCAVYGELYAGHGKALQNFIMVTLGTGVGGGIIINRKLYSGAHGNSGEIGHMVIHHNGIPCECKQRGCWEQYASVTAMIRMTLDAAKEHPESILAELCKKEVTGRTLFDAVRKGCPIAKNVLAEYSDYIMSGLCGLYKIFRPEAIILGGGITNEEELLLSNLRQEMLEDTKLMVSRLRNSAGIIGAAAMAKIRFSE